MGGQRSWRRARLNGDRREEIRSNGRTETVASVSGSCGVSEWNYGVTTSVSNTNKGSCCLAMLHSSSGAREYERWQALLTFKHRHTLAHSHASGLTNMSPVPRAHESHHLCRVHA